MKPSIFKSRKFWLMMLDVIISLATYFVGKYVVQPNDILFVIGALQPVFVALIVGIAVEDAAALKAQVYKPQ